MTYTNLNLYCVFLFFPVCIDDFVTAIENNQTTGIHRVFREQSNHFFRNAVHNIPTL